MDENTLILEGLPDDFNNIRPKLELYFKNKRRSGGEIVRLHKHPEDDKKAVLVYLDVEDANKVLDKTVHKIALKGFGEVTLMVKKQDDDHSQHAKSKPPVAPRPKMNTITSPKSKPRLRKKSQDVTEEDLQVSGIKDDIPLETKADESKHKVDLLLVRSTQPLHKEVLSMYFEKFSDSVEICETGDNLWTLKFKTQSDVQKVLKQRKHKFGISVEVYHGDTQPQPECQEKSEEGSGESNAIIVTSTEISDKEMLHMYFEQFSENFEIHKNGKTQWIVNFANQSDAQKVLAKENHALNIRVEVYNEVAMKEKLDPRRFILSGFDDICKLKVVSLYIGSCSKGEEHTWEVLDDEKILVTFKSDIDIQTFLKRCSTKKCQNTEITATSMERPDSILVQGDMSEISDDALMLYFGNKKRSGGQEVKSLTRIDERSGVVAFEDRRVVSQVTDKKHRICDTDLSVSPFYSNLQKPLAGTASSSLVDPPDVTIPIKEALYDYITRNEVCKKEITTELGKVHSNVAFDKSSESCLKLSFDAEPESLLALRLGSSWENKAKKATQDLLEKYSVNEMAVEPEVWDRIQDDSIKLSSLNATLRYKKDTAKVVVVGLQSDVRSCVEDIRQIVETTSQELEQERNTVERQIQVGSREEMDFIWDRVHTKVGDVDFIKDETSLSFVLKGLRDYVNEAEEILMEKQSDVVNQPLELSPALVEFINLAGPKTLERDLAQNNIFISLSNQEESLQIIAERSDVKSAEDKLGEILKEEEICLSPDQEMLTQGEDWKEFFEGLQEEVKSSNNVLHLKVLEGKIQVCGFSTVVADTSRKLKGYLENNKPTTEEVPMKSVREVEFVDSCMNLAEAPELKSLFVTILPNMTETSPSLKITAPSSTIKEAVTVIKNKLAQIVNNRFLYPKAGQSKVLEKHKHSLQTKAKEMGCRLFFTDQKPPDTKTAVVHKVAASQPSAEAVGGTAPTPPTLSQTTSSGSDLKVTISGVSVFLKKGDITKETVDVIVNSTNSTLNLKTGVSAAIFKAAGQSVEDECSALGTQNSDAVVLTSGGRLSCKHIAHMVGPTTAADITSSIEKVLGLCETQTASSLSVPAIGTGGGQIGAKDSIRAILKGLENHLSHATSSSIKAMYLVVFEQKVLDSYSDYFKKKNTTLPSTISHSHRGTLAADEVKIGGVRIKVKKGDITTESVKGIVNTTNSGMNLTSGVSGAIFRAAGPSVEQECKTYGSLKGDTAAVTSGGNLQCDFVIHMTGPHSAADATSRVQKVLERCEENGITTVSFPAVGTGGGGLKGQEAIIAMLQGMEDHFSQCSSTVLKLIFIVIDRDNILQAFLQGLKQWKTRTQDDEDKHSSAEDSDSDEASSSSEEEGKDIPDGKSTETLIGKIKVKVFCGDITKETTQAIVSSTNTNLDLSSGVSGAILKAAGQTVVDECKSKGTQPADGVVLTQAGSLATKHIVHMVGQTTEKDITSSMYKVLKLCEDNSIQSVSFPALGTGAGNLGAAQVACVMMDAISNFTVDCPKMVKTVHIVIFQTQMLPDFVKAIKTLKKVTPQPDSLMSQFQKLLKRATSSWTQTAPPPTQPSESLADALSKVTFPIMAVEVYSTSHNDLQQVQQNLNDLLSDECGSEQVVSRHLTQLSKSDKQNIVALSQSQQVQIQVAATDRLSVSGKKEDMLAVVLKIKDLLQGVQEREARESEEKRVRETLQWEVAEGEDWKAFNSSISYNIELAFHRKEKKVVFKDQGETYTVDLKEKTCTDSKGNKRCIKRTLLGDADTAIIHHPPTWTPMTGKDHVMVPLLHTSEEYKNIEKEFLKSSINANQGLTQKFQVVQIDRIQSRNQWQRYAVLKQTIDKRYPNQQNQRHLYHGTTKEIAQKINSNGFNRSFCGRNATMHGAGTYFAKEAWYSCSDTYSNPDDKGLKYMYRARVLTGLPCKSRANMKEPDPLDPNNLKAGLHDCAVDNLQNPFIFVVFCDAGAYPDYLITFKKA